MTRPAFVEIDLAAFGHNLKQVRKIAPASKIMAIAKANAYGHGMGNLIQGLSQADSVGVACIEEALEARASGIYKPIVLLEGFFSANELAAIAENGFQVVVHNFEQLAILEKSQMNSPLTIWLKIDTGMHRLGFLPENFSEAWRRLVACKQVAQPPNLMSHFACADECQNSMTAQQLALFRELTKDLPGLRSLANSAGILAWQDAHADWVRPGILLYGISPFADRVGAAYDLQPVMTLRSQLIAIHSLRKGEVVGYGSTWRCPEDMPIGVVAMGYGDGYPRTARNGTPVLLNGQEVPLVGRVSMDMLTVDLRSQPQAKLGDPVVLWGKGLPVERVAEAAGTLSYELVCRINKRVHQTRVGENQ